MGSPRFADLLTLLASNDVEFVVVGMTAGILQGAPTTTLDLDIVHCRSAENVDRLLWVLASVDAVYRHDPPRLRPGATHLSGVGHQLLTTTHGDLDCLGELSGGRGYDELIGHTVELQIPGCSISRP